MMCKIGDVSTTVHRLSGNILAFEKKMIHNIVTFSVTSLMIIKHS
jgi:hypothetical protein